MQLFSHMGSWLKVMDDIIADKSKREELENQLNRMKLKALFEAARIKSLN